MRKKTLALLLAVSCTLSMTACGASGDGDTPISKENEDRDESAKEFNREEDAVGGKSKEEAKAERADKKLQHHRVNCLTICMISKCGLGNKKFVQFTQPFKSFKGIIFERVDKQPFQAIGNARTENETKHRTFVTEKK